MSALKSSFEAITVSLRSVVILRSVFLGSLVLNFLIIFEFMRFFFFFQKRLHILFNVSNFIPKFH